MEHQIKAQVLKDIMKAMMQRDGSKLRPKAASVSIEEVPRVEGDDLKAPGMAHGGVVEDPHDKLHVGSESDMSPEDAEILDQLWGHGGSTEDHKAPHDEHNAQDKEEEAEEEEEAV